MISPYTDQANRIVRIVECSAMQHDKSMHSPHVNGARSLLCTAEVGTEQAESQVASQLSKPAIR